MYANVAPALLLFFITLIISSETAKVIPLHLKDHVCYAQLDIVQIQDMTSSFDGRWKRMADQVGKVMELIKESGPESYFGFTTFGDKNISGINQKTKKNHTLGYENDYCFHVDASLEAPNTERMVKLFKEYRKKISSGGGDWPENILGALYRSLLTPKLGWRGQTSSGVRVARIAVIVTDASPHLAGDAYQLTGQRLRPFDITASGMREHGDDENYDCDKVEYPTFQQVADLVNLLDVYVLLLVAPGGYYTSKRKFRPYRTVADFGNKYHGRKGLLLWYEHQFLQAGLKNVFVAELDPKMNVYADAFTKVLMDFDKFRCGAKSPTSTTTSTATTTDISNEIPLQL